MYVPRCPFICHEQLDWFHLLVIVSSAAVNMGIQLSVWDCVFSSFGCIPRSGNDESYSNSMFNFFEEPSLQLGVASELKFFSVVDKTVILNWTMHQNYLGTLKYKVTSSPPSRTDKSGCVREEPGTLNLKGFPWLSPMEQPLGPAVVMLVAQPCPTLCDPMDCSLPVFSVHGLLQARILEWVVIPFSRGSSQPRDQTQVSRIAGRFFTSWAPGMSWGQ